MIEKQHEREEGEIKDSEAAKTMKNYLGYYQSERRNSHASDHS